MPSACCYSGSPHHLTVWGQGRPHPSPIPQGWTIPGMGPFCLRAQSLYLNQERTMRLGGRCVYRAEDLCPFYRGGC